jgi:hypothetical protein
MYTYSPSNMGHKVIRPDSLYLGKSYSEWVCDWFNWFLSADADNRNSGPVVFLRSRGLPNRLTGANISDVPGANISDVPGPGDITDSSNLGTSYSASYSTAYVNDPNIRIGGDRLRIFADQAVLVPIIIAYWLRYESNTDWGSMQEFTGLTIDYGDNPPDLNQLTINRRPLAIGGDRDFAAFRIVTPIFTAVVPDVPYGKSIKDFLESPVPPGSYPAVVEGYFVMIRFDPLEEESYWIHSWASAPREVRGPYFSELLYQVDVVDRRPRVPRGRVTPDRPTRNQRILSNIAEQKDRSGDLTGAELSTFRSYFMKTQYDPKTRKEKKLGRVRL